MSPKKQALSTIWAQTPCRMCVRENGRAFPKSVLIMSSAKSTKRWPPRLDRFVGRKAPAGSISTLWPGATSASQRHDCTAAVVHFLWQILEIWVVLGEFRDEFSAVTECDFLWKKTYADGGTSAFSSIGNKDTDDQ